MITTVSKIISVVFQPLILPTYLFALVLYFLPYEFNIDDSASWKFVLVLFAITFLIPMLAILFLRLTNSISGVEMINRTERITPFSFIALFYIGTTLLFWFKFNLPDLILVLMSSITISISVLTIITYFWKISAHSLAMAGGCGILLAIIRHFGAFELHFLLVFLIFCTGLVATARLKLNAHSPTEVWYGLIAGFSLNFIVTYLLL